MLFVEKERLAFSIWTVGVYRMCYTKTNRSHSWVQVNQDRSAVRSHADFRGMRKEEPVSCDAGRAVGYPSPFIHPNHIQAIIPNGE